MLNVFNYSRIELSDRFHLSLGVYNKMLDDFMVQTKGYQDVLDIGCGSGNLSTRLLEQGHNLTCIDPNQEVLMGLLKKVEGKKCPTILNFSFEEYDFGTDKFDAVTSSLVLTYVADMDLHFHKIQQVLRPNGRFVLTYRIPDVVTTDLGYEAVMVYSEFFNQGILPAYEKEWNQLMRECSLHKIISRDKGLSVNKVFKSLRQAGFENLKKQYVLPGKDYVMIMASNS